MKTALSKYRTDRNNNWARSTETVSINSLTVSGWQKDKKRKVIYCTVIKKTIHSCVAVNGCLE